MEHEEQKGERPSAYELKRKGFFKEATAAYAKEYLYSIENKNSYIADICFEQMFDCCLLNYLKEERRFLNKNNLLEDIRIQLKEAMSGYNVPYDKFEEIFETRFEESKHKLFPKGKGEPKFSVDKKWLLKGDLGESPWYRKK